MCYDVLQANGGNRDNSHMMVPMENRWCPPDLEKREVGGFRNLTWLCPPYMLATGGSNVRREEMDRGQDMPDQDPYFLFFQWCMFQV